MDKELISTRIEREVHMVTSLKAPIRFQEYGVSIFMSITTKSSLKKAIKKGLIFINGKCASTSTFIKGGESIVLYELPIKDLHRVAKIELDICYEDDYLAIINKPSGILVSGNKLKTITNALPYNLKKSDTIDALIHPQPVHRLDFPTSGLLIIAKTNHAIIELNRMFKKRQIKKTYHAITIGSMEMNGKVDNPIDGKEAFTEYQVLSTVQSAKFNELNLVKLNPTTGRRHQLRIHLSTLGHPILGDSVYGNGLNKSSKNSLFLHASTLEFRHPENKMMLSLQAKLPAKFTKIFASGKNIIN